MPKYRVITPISGLINGAPWPAIGGVIDLPSVVGEAMPELIGVEEVEARPGSTAGVEKRPARKRVAKP